MCERDRQYIAGVIGKKNLKVSGEYDLVHTLHNFSMTFSMTFSSFP